MKTKIKETLVGLATDNEKFKSFKKKAIIPLLLVSILILIFDVPSLLSKIWIVVAIGVIMLLKIIEAIKRNKLIIDRNKLTNIILSNEDVWFYILLFGVAYPIVLILNMIFSITSFFSLICITIVLAISMLWLSRVLSKHFDKKLKKIEMFR